MNIDKMGAGLFLSAILLSALVGSALVGSALVGYGTVARSYMNPNPLKWGEIRNERMVRREESERLYNTAFNLVDKDMNGHLSLGEFSDAVKRAGIIFEIDKLSFGDLYNCLAVQKFSPSTKDADYVGCSKRPPIYENGE